MPTPKPKTLTLSIDIAHGNAWAGGDVNLDWIWHRAYFVAKCWGAPAPDQVADAMSVLLRQSSATSSGAKVAKAWFAMDSVEVIIAAVKNASAWWMITPEHPCDCTLANTGETDMGSNDKWEATFCSTGHVTTSIRKHAVRVLLRQWALRDSGAASSFAGAASGLHGTTEFDKAWTDWVMAHDVKQQFIAAPVAHALGYVPGQHLPTFVPKITDSKTISLLLVKCEEAIDDTSVALTKTVNTKGPIDPPVLKVLNYTPAGAKFAMNHTPKTGKKSEPFGDVFEEQVDAVDPDFATATEILTASKIELSGMKNVETKVLGTGLTNTGATASVFELSPRSTARSRLMAIRYGMSPAKTTGALVMLTSTEVAKPFYGQLLGSTPWTKIYKASTATAVEAAMGNASNLAPPQDDKCECSISYYTKESGEATFTIHRCDVAGHTDYTDGMVAFEILRREWAKRNVEYYLDTFAPLCGIGEDKPNGLKALYAVRMLLTAYDTPGASKDPTLTVSGLQSALLAQRLVGKNWTTAPKLAGLFAYIPTTDETVPKGVPTAGSGYEAWPLGDGSVRVALVLSTASSKQVKEETTLTMWSAASTVRLLLRAWPSSKGNLQTGMHMLEAAGYYGSLETLRNEVIKVKPSAWPTLLSDPGLAKAYEKIDGTAKPEAKYASGGYIPAPEQQYHGYGAYGVKKKPKYGSPFFEPEPKAAELTLDIGAGRSLRFYADKEGHLDVEFIGGDEENMSVRAALLLTRAAEMIAAKAPKDVEPPPPESSVWDWMKEHTGIKAKTVGTTGPGTYYFTPEQTNAMMHTYVTTATPDDIEAHEIPAKDFEAATAKLKAEAEEVKAQAAKFQKMADAESFANSAEAMFTKTYESATGHAIHVVPYGFGSTDVTLLNPAAITPALYVTHKGLATLAKGWHTGKFEISALGKALDEQWSKIADSPHITGPYTVAVSVWGGSKAASWVAKQVEQHAVPALAEQKTKETLIKALEPFHVKMKVSNAPSYDAGAEGPEWVIFPVTQHALVKLLDLWKQGKVSTPQIVSLAKKNAAVPPADVVATLTLVHVENWYSTIPAYSLFTTTNANSSTWSWSNISAT
jgi:hypothetical protein